MTLPLSPADQAAAGADPQSSCRVGEEWAYEQKLDGFRAIVFVDGDEAYVQSRGGKELARYFPELSFAPGRYVLDGELVIRDADGKLEFDALQKRIHPAAVADRAARRRRSPPATSSSTSWPRATSRCWRRRWRSGGHGWRRSPPGRTWS